MKIKWKPLWKLPRKNLRKDMPLNKNLEEKKKKREKLKQLPCKLREMLLPKQLRKREKRLKLRKLDSRKKKKPLKLN